MLTEIPKGDYDSPAPCWIPTQRNDNGQPTKPLIKCNCGRIFGIGLHHVHADGTVTRSFFHAKEALPDQGWPGGGCGWHVWLRLKDYDCGDFPPTP
jgi:hypothetical protein